MKPATNRRPGNVGHQMKSLSSWVAYQASSWPSALSTANSASSSPASAAATQVTAAAMSGSAAGSSICAEASAVSGTGPLMTTAAGPAAQGLPVPLSPAGTD